MKKSIQRSYPCLTLGRREIQELIYLFQQNLQEVEITIDGTSIVDSAQLDAFDSAYQATSMLARGYEPLEVDATGKQHRQLVELRMGKMSALLFIKPGSGRQLSGVAQQIEQVLLRCQNRKQHILVTGALTTSVLFSVFFWTPLEHTPLPFPQLLLIAAPGTLVLAPLFLYLFAFISHTFKFDTCIFLFPAATNIPPQTGRREAVGMALVALGCVIAVSAISEIVKFLLWG